MSSPAAFEKSPPVFDLGDLRLRPLRAGDELYLAAYLGDPLVTEHTSIPPVTADSLAAAVRRDIAAYAGGTSCRLALAKSDDELIGICGFNNWSLVHGHAELAYDLAPAYWGRGYMRRAVEALLAWAFNSVALNRVHAFVMTSNLRSIGLLERCGFTREGTLRQYRMARGTPRDFHVYALLAKDFASVVVGAPPVGSEAVSEYVARILGYVTGEDPLLMQAEAPDVLASLVEGLSSEDLGRRPAPSKWSIREIVAHLADDELVCAYRIRLILSSPGTAIQAFDQDVWARTGKYSTADVKESLMLYRTLRQQNLRLLHSLSPEEWDMFGVHAERGVESLRHIARYFAGHDVNHFRQIEAILNAK